MRKYFIVLGYQRKGPFSIEELKQNNVTKDTLIWTFDLGSNTPAGEIPELASILGDAEVVEKHTDPKQDNDKEVLPEKSTTLNEEELLKIYEESKRKDDAEKSKKQAEPDEQTKNEENKIIPILEAIKQEKKEEKIEEEKKEEKIEEKIQKEKVVAIEPTKNKTLPIIEGKKTYTHKEFHSKPSPPAHKKPKNYMLASILATIFCCLPLGIVGILMASQVDSKYRAGDYEGAETASNNARIMLIIAVIFGISIFVGFAIIGENG